MLKGTAEVLKGTASERFPRVTPGKKGARLGYCLVMLLLHVGPLGKTLTECCALVSIFLLAAPMMHRYSLDRFKKAQTEEPFSVNNGASVQGSGSVSSTQPRLPFVSLQARSSTAITSQMLPPASQKPLAGEQVTAPSSSVGGGQSTWQPPDWAVEPRPGLYWLDVLKDGDVVDKINLEKRRNIFGRQAVMCDFVLDHPSVSRQHAVVVQHKNGRFNFISPCIQVYFSGYLYLVEVTFTFEDCKLCSVYVIDLGSVHGTFVANERLSKESPLELEVGQSLKFAASTRSYVLRKGVAQVPQLSQPPVNFVLPPPPDPSDEEAVVAYNTLLNKLGMFRQNQDVLNASKKLVSKSHPTERSSKRVKKARVTFRDQYNGVLVEVVGISDGADVSMEPGPLGVKEGSLVGRFDDLVEITVIPKGKESVSKASHSTSARGVTEKLQQFIEKVKSPAKESLYDDSIAVSNPWAKIGDKDTVSLNGEKEEARDKSSETLRQASSTMDDDLDDLFGDA
ncbi:hypothetical protein L7F22_025571 [Adiantum nelumboides]|nr:hypothetical protein [Adiantum nelumboides]